MKKIVLISAIIFSAAVFFSFREMKRVAISGVLQQLGIDEESAKGNTFNSLSSNYFSVIYKPSYKQFSGTERARIVNELGAWAKAYTKSQEFLERYEQFREDMKPAPPSAQGSAGEDKARQKAELDKNIKDMETTMRSLPAEQQASMREVVKMLKEQRKGLDDPGNETFSNEVVDNAYAQQHQAASEEYSRRMKEWEHDYPVSPNAMIKKRLEHFLSMSASVDFNAQLRPNGKKMAFVNPEYEKKDMEWKECFRSGKEAVTAARTFIKQWVAELH